MKLSVKPGKHWVRTKGKKNPDQTKNVASAGGSQTPGCVGVVSVRMLTTAPQNVREGHGANTA